MSGAEARHRGLRERLGLLALDRLPPEEAAIVRAHLRDCPACRADLAEIAPAAADLRLVAAGGRDAGPAAPPPGLGARIAEAVRAESGVREARDRAAARRSRLRRLAAPVLAAAAAALVTAVLLTAGRGPAPEVAGEQLRITSVAAGLTGTTAVLVPHTWGIEVKVVAGGLVAGRAYHGVVRARDGRVLPAGEFLGTGASPVRCNLQSALLRDDTAGFAIVDSDGRTVLDLAVPAST